MTYGSSKINKIQNPTKRYTIHLKTLNTYMVCTKQRYKVLDNEMLSIDYIKTNIKLQHTMQKTIINDMEGLHYLTRKQA